MRDGFAEYHPIVNMLYYVAVIGTAMFIMHPIFLTLSFLGAVTYEIYLKRTKGVTFVAAMVPVFVIMSLINPLFSHKGMTLICYLPTGNPLTLESVLFGVASGAMIVTVIIWFATFNTIMTGDKIITVAGGVFPALGMILSMVLRFVPKFTNQAKKIAIANQALKGNFQPKDWRNNIKSFGIMVTWSLENSVITADSMRARGYGSCKRTSFSMYKFQLRDGVVLGIVVVIFLWNVGVLVSGRMKCNYYPRFIIEGPKSLYQWLVCMVPHMVLCFLPTVINVKEDIKWHRLKSKI